ITLSEDCFKRVGVNFADGNRPCGGATACLNDTQMYGLLEAVQGDQRSNVLMAPKILTLSGQTAVVNPGDQKTFVTGVDAGGGGDHVLFRPQTKTVEIGTRLVVTPEVSADHCHVAVRLNAALSQVAAAVPVLPVAVTVPGTGAGEPGQPTTFTQFIQS